MGCSAAGKQLRPWGRSREETEGRLLVWGRCPASAPSPDQGPQQERGSGGGEKSSCTGCRAPSPDGHRPAEGPAPAQPSHRVSRLLAENRIQNGP